MRQYSEEHDGWLLKKQEGHGEYCVIYFVFGGILGDNIKGLKIDGTLSEVYY